MLQFCYIFLLTGHKNLISNILLFMAYSLKVFGDLEVLTYFFTSEKLFEIFVCD